MINIPVNRVEDGIRVSGEMGAESSDALIEELACLCSDAIDMMAKEYEGKDDIGEQLERTLAEAITRRRVWNAQERMERAAQGGLEVQGELEAQGDALD